MYPTCPPVHHNRSFQFAPAGSAPPMPVDRTLRQAQLLSNCSVLPEQFFNPSPSFFSGRPVAALLRAVLEDALACFQRQFLNEGRRVQREAQEAEAWFLSKDSHSPFSFESICAVLGLEPEAIRQRLRRWSYSHPVAPQRKIRRIVVRHLHGGIS